MVSLFTSIFGTSHWSRHLPASHVSSLQFLLDTHQSEVFGSDRGSFVISFNQDLDAFDAVSRAFTIMPGQSTLFWIRYES